jgi:hypothetical protein
MAVARYSGYIDRCVIGKLKNCANIFLKIRKSRNRGHARRESETHNETLSKFNCKSTAERFIIIIILLFTFSHYFYIRL